MKIDIVAPFFHPVLGGGEHYTIGVATGMAKRGHDVTVHTASYNPVNGEHYALEDQFTDGVKIKRYDPAFRAYHYFWWWKPEIKRSDLVHVVGYGHFFSD